MGVIESNNFKTLRFLIKDENGQTNPKLILNERIGDERVKRECPKGYEGEFIKVAPYSYKTEDGKENKGFSVYLWDDKDGEVRFNTARTNPATRFLNYLLGRKGSVGKVRISYSMKERNGKQQVTLRLNIDGQLSNLLISKDEINEKKLVYPIIDPETNEVIKYSYSKLHEFLESKFDEFNAQATQPSIGEELEKKAELNMGDTLREKAKSEDDDEGLPF